MKVFESPRRTVEIHVDESGWRLRSEAIEADWLGAMLKTARRVGVLEHPGLAVATSASIVDGRLHANGPMPPAVGLMEGAPRSARQWAQLVAQLADAAVVLGAVTRLGELHPGQIRVAAHGPMLLGGGVTAEALRYDEGLRGAAMTTRTFRSSPESVMGQPTDAHTDSFHLAYFLFEAVCHTEPFARPNAFEYMANVRSGRLVDPAAHGAPEPLAAALRAGLGPRDTRPTPAEFADTLRRI